MKKDILEKGAIVQRDGMTYAIAPHIPAGLVTPHYLRTLANVSEHYGAKALKITSAQRIALIGLAEEDLDGAWAELGENPGRAIGLCVRSVKVCPGNTFCKRGRQDSVALGLELDRRYHGFELPWKFKMGVSGCPIDCAEGCIKDIAVAGTAKGWNINVGGNGGANPALSRQLVAGLESQEQVLEIVDRIIQWFAAQGQKSRLSKLIEGEKFDVFRTEILGT